MPVTGECMNEKSNLKEAREVCKIRSKRRSVAFDYGKMCEYITYVCIMSIRIALTVNALSIGRALS